MLSVHVIKVLTGKANAQVSLNPYKPGMPMSFLWDISK